MKKFTRFCFALKTVVSLATLLWLPNLLSAQVNVTLSPTHVTCFGAANGQVVATPSGGTGPYSYSWSNNSTTQSIANLTPGAYMVTVKDADQISATAGVIITQPTQLNVVTFSQSQLCEVAPDGMATAVPSGGSPGYTYLWSNSSVTPQIEQLVAGTYTVTVSDTKGCTATSSTSVNFWDEGLWLMTNSTQAQCAFENGTAEVSPGSGTAPYEYQWSNGASSQTVENLGPGVYTVTVTDARGCSADAEVLINSNAPISVFALLTTPLCLSNPASFLGWIAPPEYPQLLWTLSNPLDQIISGQGTDSIQVQWGEVGSKAVQMQFGANGLICGSITYSLEVVVCADATEPAIAAAEVWPNPFSDFIRITFPTGMPAETEVVLSDASGKVLSRKILRTPSDFLSTEDIPKGFYFLKIKSGNTENGRKVIKS